MITHDAKTQKLSHADATRKKTRTLSANRARSSALAPTALGVIIHVTQNVAVVPDEVFAKSSSHK